MKRDIIYISLMILVNSYSFSQTYQNKLSDTLSRYIYLNNLFLENKNVENRKSVENYYEKSVIPTLSLISEKICLESDSILANKFFNTLMSSLNNSDENIGITLARIYVCKPKMVINFVNDLKVSDKKDFLNRLEFGFLNLSSLEKINNYYELNNNLIKLKSEMIDNSQN